MPSKSLLKGIFYTISIGWLFTISNPTLGAQVDGAIIARIPDTEASRCINMQSDSVTFHLARVVENKSSDWFKNDKTIGLYVETTLEGATASSTKKISFPRAFLIDVQQYSGGLVSLPVEERLLSQFRLLNGGHSYSSAKFTIKLVKISQPGAAANAINLLADVTKSLPMPANPLAEGFEFFVDLSNKLVSNYVDKDISDDRAPQAQISFEFSANGDCSGDLETTGVIAVIFKGNELDSVDISKEATYCFRYVQSPVKGIRVASKTSHSCPSDESVYAQLSNPYYLFLLIATKSELTSGRSTQYSWYADQAKNADIKPSKFSFDINEVKKAIGSWNNGASRDKSVTMATLGDEGFNEGLVTKYLGSDPFNNTEGYNIQKTWASGAVPDTIAKIAGIADPQENDFIIGKQAIMSPDAIGQDIAVAIKRCKIIDIPIDKCL